jgi:hypothetical protein
LTIATYLQNAIGTSSTGKTLFQALNAVDDELLGIDHVVQAIETKVNLVLLNQATAYTDILAAIAALPDGTGPVTLPTTPPAGYGVDDGSIAGAVWAYNVGGGTQAAGDLLYDAGWLAINMGVANVRLPSTFSKYYDVRGTWISNSGTSSPSADPIFPIANIHPTDTLSDFLERESYYTGWTANEDGTYYVYQDPAHTDFKITTTITAAEFLVLRDGPAAAAALLTPPIWPGIANATLGSTTALSMGLTVTEPMDGVIIELTSVPTVRGFYMYDDLKAYVNVGALAFVDDNGQAENYQALSFEEAIYTPKSMLQAAAVKVRAGSGVTGTITPWVKTP